MWSRKDRAKLMGMAGVVALMGMLPAAAAYAATVNGIVTDTETDTVILEESTYPVRQAIVLPPDAMLINFDDTAAPCLFMQTTALTDRYYSTYGVTFAGPGGNDGGAILNQCGNFSVSGHSSPNFLAFNTYAKLSNGGIPRGTESIYFKTPVDSVFVNAGQGGTVTIECYNTSGVSVGSDVITGASILQTLVVSGSAISRCDIAFTGSLLVVDDLAFIPSRNQPPIADAGPNQAAVQGDEVCFNGSGSSDTDSDPLTYSWAFTAWPAGSTTELDNPTSEKPCFTADLPGTYKASLIVNDGTVDSAPSTAEAVVISYREAINQLCPCDGPKGKTDKWKNHGQYVSCVSKSAESFLEDGRITEAEKDAICSDAGQSGCGAKMSR